MTWKIWYDDGSTFDSTQGEPWESPPWGAVIIMQDAPHMDMLANGGDHFIYRSDVGQWFCINRLGLDDQLAHFAPFIDCVRHGRFMNSKDFKALCKLAAVDWRGK